ncbi:MAG: hypothetical protein NC911_00530 [Candidatus Omnitrophica bacterium]|nr:hypothetical protein [Candidatus Omnitrophota bacterium]
MISQKDKKIIRDLAKQVKEIASLPIQEEKRRLWRKLNRLEAERPMVLIAQVCWNEMNVNEELNVLCESPECQHYEIRLRRLLYQWRHFPVDMVMEPFIPVFKAVSSTGFGIEVKEEILVTDPTSSVVSHKFINQFETESDLEKIKEPLVSYDEGETQRQLEVAEELFGGLLEVRSRGVEPYLSLWDPLATWMGVENALLALVERPDYIHQILDRMPSGYLSLLDQLEKNGLLCPPQSLIHCTGAWTDELPAFGYNPEKPRTKDIWMFGLAQMLGTVSPKMFKEFEVDYTARIANRFGLVYYGCCEPLHDKIAEVRLIPHVRKISMSPWVDQEKAAEQIGRDFVFSRKPNPAFLAGSVFDEELVRKDLFQTKKICQNYGCSLEFILKDISTVRYQPERLFQWAKVAMEVAQE